MTRKPELCLDAPGASVPGGTKRVTYGEPNGHAVGFLIDSGAKLRHYAVPYYPWDKTEIVIESKSSNGNAYGITQAMGNREAGSAVRILNKGKIDIHVETGVSGNVAAYGICLTNQSTLTNSGSIETRVKGDTAYGIHLRNGAISTACMAASCD